MARLWTRKTWPPPDPTEVDEIVDILSALGTARKGKERGLINAAFGRAGGDHPFLPGDRVRVSPRASSRDGLAKRCVRPVNWTRLARRRFAVSPLAASWMGL